MQLDLNCDLGEGEPLEKTEALMRYVTSANIACGGHAGDDRSIRGYIELALKYGVKIGAHPGMAGEFGRGERVLSRDDFLELLRTQLTRFRRHTGEANAGLHHVKLHGNLYHQSERSAEIRGEFLDFMSTEFPRCIIYCLAGGIVATEAKGRGMQAWEEVFLDRNYLSNGFLVPRSRPDALLHDVGEVRSRLGKLTENKLYTIDGTLLEVRPRTLCVHSDSPNAIEIANMASDCLGLKSKQAD